MFCRKFLFGEKACKKDIYEPERGYGFVSEQSFRVDVPRPGEYKVTVTLQAEQALGKIFIFIGSGNLVFLGNISAGSFSRTMTVNVGDRIPVGQSCICEDRALLITVAAPCSCLSSLSVKEAACPTIYIAGSTEVTKEEQGDARPPQTTGGWQRMFTAYTNEKIAVSDHSRPGLTPDSFRREGHYAAMGQYSRSGDFYFLQFAYGEAENDYCRQLIRYIIECRERLIYPVLFTPPVYGKISMGEASSVREKGADNACVWACREVGRRTETPVIELHRLIWKDCDAYTAAGIVAREIARSCKSHPVRGYRFLADCLTSVS